MSMGYGETVRRPADDDGRVQKFFSYVDEEGEIIQDKGRTKQEFAKEADINNIVGNILKTGSSDWLEKHEEWLKTARDSIVPDVEYREIMSIMADAGERFVELPSEVREGFNNDPAEFMEFVQSEKGDIDLAELIAVARPAVVKAGSIAEGSKPVGQTPAQPAEPEPDPGAGPDSGEE